MGSSRICSLSLLLVTFRGGETDIVCCLQEAMTFGHGSDSSSRVSLHEIAGGTIHRRRISKTGRLRFKTFKFIKQTPAGTTL